MTEHLENGQNFLLDGNLDAARAAFITALEEEPENMGARYGLARVQALSGETEEALAGYLEAIAAEPQARGLAWYAELKMLGEDIGDAAERIEQAFELDPDIAEPYLLGAELAIRAKDYDRADSLLRKGVRRGAEIGAAHVFSLYQRWVTQLVENDEAAKASEVSGRAADFFVSDVSLMLLAAKAAETAGHKEAALERYRDSLGKLPQGPLRIEVLEKIATLV